MGDRASINHVSKVTKDVADEVDAMFHDQTWDDDQLDRQMHIRAILTNAVLEIIQQVPPCPDRSTAIRKIREARMDCNSAITHHGRF